MHLIVSNISWKGAANVANQILILAIFHMTPLATEKKLDVLMRANLSQRDKDFFQKAE